VRVHVESHIGKFIFGHTVDIQTHARHPAGEMGSTDRLGNFPFGRSSALNPCNPGCFAKAVHWRWCSVVEDQSRNDNSSLLMKPHFYTCSLPMAPIQTRVEFVMEELPEAVVNLNRLLDSTYNMLVAVIMELPLHVPDEDEPLMPGDPRRDEHVIDLAHYYGEYIHVQAEHELPQSMLDKHAFLVALTRWMVDPTEDLFIDIEYNPDDFGEDVAKVGYTPAEVEQHTVKRARKRFRLDVEQPHCTICLEAFEPDTEVRRLNCWHIYHDHCLQGWLKNHTTCPLCLVDIAEKRKKKSVRGLQPTRRSKRLRGIPPE